MQPTTYHPDDELPSKDDYNRLEHFRRRRVEPPSELYVTLDDVVLLEGFSAIATTTINVSMRLLTPEGEVVPFFQQFNILAQGVTATPFKISNLEGFILSISVTQAAGLRGSVFVRMTLQRGVGSGDATRGQVLISGYTSSVDALGFPQGALESSLDGRGLIQIVSVANPAAGADYVITVPAGVNWIVRAIRFVLTTAAGGGNRQVSLRFDDGAGHIFAEMMTNQILGGAASAVYSFASGFSVASLGNNVQGSMPAESRLAGGFRITTSTSGLAGADQFSACALDAETYLGT